MSPAFEIPNDQREPLVGFRRSWFRLGQGARSALGRSTAVERTVWPMLVVADREQRHLFADRGDNFWSYPEVRRPIRHPSAGERESEGWVVHDLALDPFPRPPLTI